MSTYTGPRVFHHIGLPTDVRQTGEVYVADTKVWVTDPRRHAYKVEFLRYEPDSPVTQISEFRGSRTVMSLRLCSRAP